MAMKAGIRILLPDELTLIWYAGSYSYRPPPCDKVSIGPWTLSTPVMYNQGRSRIFFAGEATDTEHYGTVTGAMVAGGREACRVVNIMRGGAGRE